MAFFFIAGHSKAASLFKAVNWLLDDLSIQQRQAHKEITAYTLL
ncbi:hypothetical protein [Sporolactobacillus nakayamae]|nr:hypothetical protein [Sporolactobacillus nakayamae]